MNSQDIHDPDFVKLGYRFLRLYMQIYGANADLLQWADEIVNTANTRVVYPQNNIITRKMKVINKIPIKIK
jgi:hypothetical protein